jgi:DNA-binding transcriptional MerR regulator
MDKVIYELQDKYIDLKRLRDYIRSINGVITDMNDAYLGEELYHQRLAHRTKEFLENEEKPLLAAMRAGGVSIEELETFLHARHAPEANAEMAKRNPNQAEIDAGQKAAEATVRTLERKLQTAQARGLSTTALEQALNDARGKLANWNGAQAFRGTEAERLSLSGMSDQAAAAVMSSLSPERRATLDALASRVDAINEGTLQTLEDYGLMSKEALREWRKTYRYYIPLHRDEAHPDSASHPIGQGFSTKGDAAKRRTGSNAEVTNILAHVMMQRATALRRGEKNHVMLKLYLMARQNPLEDVWKVGSVPMKKSVDDATGFVERYPDPQYKSLPNVLMLRIAGKDVAITMNEHNPEALRMAQALKNLDVDDLHYIIPMFAKVTRWFAAMATQYNPIFGIINLMRDTQDAALNLSSTELAGKQKDVLKDQASILKDVLKNGGRMPKTGKWADLYREFQEVGGTTGYTDLYLDAESRGKELEKTLQSFDQGKAKQAWHAVAEWLSDYNEAMENSTRLAAYKAALDNGMSKERAASLAKNLTVNFNRKGRQTRELGAFYAFFNAAVQGTARMLETLKGPAGRKIMAGGVALGALDALLGIAMMGGGSGDDDEWDKIPDFVKERAIIIPLGKQDYFSIPLPIGFQFLPNLGRMAVETAVYKDKSAGKQFATLFNVMADAFNPLGGGSTPFEQMPFPTVVRPAVALMENKDWTGKSIYIENRNSLSPQPGFKRSKDSATPWAKGIAWGVNAATGGTDYTPGAVSWTPDQIDYVIQQLTGGVGREVSKTAATVSAPFTGEELPPYKMPLVGRLYGSTAGHSGQSEKFYENVTRANEAENEIKGRAKDGIGLADYLRENPWATELAARGNAAEHQIAALRKMRHEIILRDGADKVAKVREINDRIGEAMRGFNREAERLQ